MTPARPLPGRLLAAAVLAALLVAGGCDRSQREAEQAAARAAAEEQAADKAAADFDAAVAQENWALAKAQADVLMATHPGSGAAARVQAQYDAVKQKADAAREDARLAGLWTYNTQTVESGDQLSASIYSKAPVDAGAGAAQPVRLIFRDHPGWGRSSYLVLANGDFDCYGGCKVQVAVDGGAPVAMAASRPETDEAIAMFIEDERALWRRVRGAKTVTIQFPVKGAGRQSATFEVGGLDGARMPGWDRAGG